MTVDEALLRAEQHLGEHRVDSAGMTARLLLADALGRGQAWLVAHSEDRIAPERYECFWEMIRLRSAGCPTQYIRGVQEFYSLDFVVTPDVLIPRPETEHVVEAALARLRRGDRILDIGTGSGAIAVAIATEAPGVRVTASDISRRAARVAARNARRLAAAVEFCVGDIGRHFLPRRFDMVVSNPPYVPLAHAPGLQRELRHEPAVALFGGEDGLAVGARLIEGAPRLLKPGGWLLAEIGFGQKRSLEAMLDRRQWRTPEFIRDLAGIDRVVAVRLA